MNLIGKKVKHNKFGNGIITDQDDSYVSVIFAKDKTPRKFQYPSCFKSFLKLLDADAAAQTNETVKKHEEKEKKEKQKAAEKAKSDYFSEKMTKNCFKASKTINLQTFTSVNEFCEEYKKQISSEIFYLRNNGGKRNHIFDGKLVESKNGRFIYTFEMDDELNYPEGTQISIWREDDCFSGHIIGCEDFTIIIESDTYLGNDIPSLEFSAEPWRLLYSLNERLDDIINNPNKIVKSLICDGQKAIEYGNPKIKTGQQTAIQMSQNQPITFVWGPPGTGKTETLAKIALSHIKRGNRVLMLSYSNVSVDGAIMRVNKLNPNSKPGTLVRYGYAQNKELLNHKYLTSYNLVINNHPDLLKERQKLIAERKKLSRDSKRYVEIGRRLSQIKKKLSSEEKEEVRKAKFVATTISKAVVDSVIRDTAFDVVIFDEASMAYIPQIALAASLAKKHFICMGDFRQLPPIVQSKENSSLNADIFQYCGIISAVDSKNNHDWLCMLDTQYRMHPDIAKFASSTMYGGLLKSAEEMNKKHNNIISQNPSSGHSMAFADLSGMMSVCTKTGDNSRINLLSALMSFSLALDAAKNCQVGIITPYHSQSRLLHAMSRDAANSNTNLKLITCATVHQFQGSEKDVIIYDAVDCYRMPYPGMLLTSTRNNYANRLFNVAITRAKGKFIGVANVEYMDNKKLSKGLVFKNMIEMQRKQPSCSTGRQLLRTKTKNNYDIMNFYNKKEGNISFLKDIENARREIRIDIPDKPVDDNFCKQLAMALKDAKRKGIKVYLRAENKQGISSTLKPFAIENKFVANPIVLIDKKIIWFGMPSSNAMFKAEGNIIQTKYRPIIRFKGSHTATAIYGYIGMNKTIDQSKNVSTDEDGNAITDTFANYVLANKKCPSCGKPMQLKKSRKGKFFLSCTGYPNCHETELVDVNFVEQYFYRNGGRGQLCPRCNCSLEAKLGPYGLYIQCCGYPPHKYKLDEV